MIENLLENIFIKVSRQKKKKKKKLSKLGENTSILLEMLLK